MAYEKSEPKNGLIVQIAILSIASFFVVRYGVVSLFHRTLDDEFARKNANAGREELAAQRDEAAKKLAGLAGASAEYAKRGRGASAQLSPAATPCDAVDQDPSKGWSLSPTGFVAAPCPVTEDDAGVADGGASDARAESAAPANPSKK